MENKDQLKALDERVIALERKLQSVWDTQLLVDKISEALARTVQLKADVLNVTADAVNVASRQL